MASTIIYCQFLIHESKFSPTCHCKGQYRIGDCVVIKPDVVVGEHA